MVFTGDSYYAYDLDPAVKSKKEPINQGSEFYRLPKTIYQHKAEQKKVAAIETQPVCTTQLAAGETISDIR